MIIVRNINFARNSISENYQNETRKLYQLKAFYSFFLAWELRNISTRYILVSIKVKSSHYKNREICKLYVYQSSWWKVIDK